MSSILLAAVVQTAVLATGADSAPAVKESYAEAQRLTIRTGRPMVVMVSTDWCPPCQMMKKTILPRVRERGLLRKVAFAVVNPDHDKELAEKLIGSGPIPQLVMFRKKGDAWVQKSLVGGQSVETVEEFIREGLAKDAADTKKPPSEAGKKKKVLPGEETTVQHDGVADSDEVAQHG